MVESNVNLGLRKWLSQELRLTQSQTNVRLDLRALIFLVGNNTFDLGEPGFDELLLDWLRFIITEAVGAAVKRPVHLELRRVAYETAKDSNAFVSQVRSSSDEKLISHGVRLVDLFGNPLRSAALELEVHDRQSKLLSFLSNNPGFSFWARWYERMASGNPMNWEMQEEIALIPDEDWKQGAAHVSKLIAEIEAKYAAQSLPLAEDLEVDWDGRVYAVPVPVPQGDVYAEALEAVQDALDDALLGDNQALNGDDLEARILSRTLEKYREKPYRVHQDFTIVRDNLRGKLGDVFADDHAPIVNLIRAVEDGAVNIRRAVPRVRETVAANAKIRFEEASEEDRAAVVAGLELLEADAREDFEGELKEDHREIVGPQSEATLTAALYRTFSRMTKVQRFVLGGVGGLTAIAGGIVTWEAAIRIILRFIP